jgi:pyrroloquinoline quinone (PQQ) biosynthesis protein C
MAMKTNKSPKLKFCALDGILQGLAEPLAAPVLTSGDCEKALSEANLLADRAYSENDQAAVDLAERLLYLVHATTNFSPPISCVGGIVWPVLMRAKLRAELGGFRVPENITTKTFVEHFSKAVRQADDDNSVVTEIGNAKDRANMVRYVKNYLCCTGGFTHQLFSLTKHSSGKLRKVLVDNIGDEFTDGKEHRDLRYIWPRQLGLEVVPADIVRDPEFLTEAFSVQNFRTGLSLLPKSLAGVGMFYSVEALFPNLAGRLRKALMQVGLEEKYLEHLILHETADVEHLESGLKVICATIKDDKELHEVLAGALVHLKLRHKMMTAIRGLVGLSKGNRKKSA